MKSIPRFTRPLELHAIRSLNSQMNQLCKRMERIAQFDTRFIPLGLSYSLRAYCARVVFKNLVQKTNLHSIK